MTTFIFPTVTRVASGFRTKDRPDHHGVDFAMSGIHEIKCVCDGIVTRSYFSDSYGEVVFVKHTLNGEVWETVYAHMRKNSRKVKQNQKVKQGEVLGVMGNTGHSFGQHLHFELHRGYWNINKTKAVNPIDYLGKDLTPKQEYKNHLVKGGDSLSKIAVQYKTTVDNLMKLNPHVKNKNIIYINQMIKVPK